MRSVLLALAVLALAACAGDGITRRPGPAPRSGWVVYPEAEVKDVKNAHEYKGAPLCQRCHASPGGRLRAKVPELCFECHGAAKMTHVGMIQTPPPATLPYEAGGRILCHTCHEPHDVKAQKFGFRAEYAKVCLECHKGH